MFGECVVFGLMRLEVQIVLVGMEVQRRSCIVVVHPRVEVVVISVVVVIGLVEVIGVVVLVVVHIVAVVVVVDSVVVGV